MLAASSPFFYDLLTHNPSENPMVILPEEVGLEEMALILQFVYKGRVEVEDERLQPLLVAANTLKVIK